MTTSRTSSPFLSFSNWHDRDEMSLVEKYHSIKRRLRNDVFKLLEGDTSFSLDEYEIAKKLYSQYSLAIPSFKDFMYCVYRICYGYKSKSVKRHLKRVKLLKKHKK